LSKTLLNRLAMFEILDTYGPLTTTELAQRSGLDITVVSRTVAACEPDGWLVRLGGRIALGPRLTLLGHAGPLADVIALAAPLVHAIAGVTGVLSHAYALVGRESVLIATADGRARGGPAGLSTHAPLYATAAGRAIAIQLDPAQLGSLLPAEPYPNPEELIATMVGTSAETLFNAPSNSPDVRGEFATSTLARTRRELETQLDVVRSEWFSLDGGALDPGLHCIAVPWSHSVLPLSLACLGSPEDIDGNAALIQTALRAAAAPGATARSVVAAAAVSITPPSTATRPETGRD
jgi:DNA-binding IclR family transcriptional regulator